MNAISLLSLLWYGASTAISAVSAWDATWDSLDRRPLPSWYDEAKFGIFIHWGVFSVPAYGSEWFWKYYHECSIDNSSNFGDYCSFVRKTESPYFRYPAYAHRFTAELYDPSYWARIFAKSGAQYVVLTSKHHEGFCNWNSSTSWNWNAVDVGPRADILGALARAVKNVSSSQTRRKLKFGVYHSLFEWFNPQYLSDQASNWTSQSFVKEKTMPELYDLVNKYEPELIWSDGDWEAPSDYWESTKFLAWYATNSTVAETAVWNDRWGNDNCLCNHGSFVTCADRYQPGQLQMRKWENAFTIDKNSWGFSRKSLISDYMTTKEIVHQLIETVAFNGNVLLNIGPSADGTISPIFLDRLMNVGKWLQTNGEAIYDSKPWIVAQNESASQVFYTSNTDTSTLFVHIMEWPKDGIVSLQYPVPTDETEVRFIGLSEKVVYKAVPHLVEGGRNVSIEIELPALTPDTIPCDHAWVLALTNISNMAPRGRVDPLAVSRLL
jgi:alpha-L-fucosidase